MPRASELWESWTNRQRSSSVADKTILPWVLEQLGDFTGNDLVQDEGEWRQYMDAAGLTVDFQDRVWSPFFEWVRQNGTCKHWVVHTIESRYDTLLDFRDDERERQQLTSHSG
ncbi:hypothetical protein Micbo1qcDRAFT_203477 [Microdochium bolleyi]|uniref:Uncharacterized protein n=1 Tax=Microdochium bolleyi TaxID=196109 RepID=A0A136J896_9PEZI|nr:hypothetical protein Micbo1qcDRAFT_203477 [Microdochium bolleyi]